MKIIEVRVGNLIEYNNNGCPVYICGIYNEYIYYNHLRCCSPANTMNPIKITEKWLFKFGFELSEQSDDVFEIGNFQILRMLGNTFELFSHDSPVEIKFVHQVQNLYFALTGSELVLG